MSPLSYQSARPGRLLQPCVARYWQLESDGRLLGSPGRWALPDGGSEWIFVLADPLVRASRAYQAGAYAAGIALAAYLSESAGRVLTFGVVFRPGGAAAVSRLPANQLTGLVVPLQDVWGPGAASTADRLAQSPGFRARVQLIERDLLARLRPTDTEVADAIGRLAASPGMTVGNLAADAASARRLERKFLAQVGIGPKRLSRMFRLQHATRLWEAGRVKGWADLAAAAGYSDQSHMVREYRELAGTSPVRLAKREPRMSNSFKTGSRRSENLDRRSAGD